MGKKTLFGFIQDQRRPIPAVEPVDLSGRTVLVVGANAGLGLEATKHFAAMNPSRIVLACRNEEKGKAALASGSSHNSGDSDSRKLTNLRFSLSPGERLRIQECRIVASRFKPLRFCRRFCGQMGKGRWEDRYPCCKCRYCPLGIRVNDRRLGIDVRIPHRSCSVERDR
jgi:hypothetical protein